MFGRRESEGRAQAALLRELEAQRAAAKNLVDRYEAESGRARSAILAVGKAREERDEYRRVLAAAIAEERRREAQLVELKEDRSRLEAIASGEIRGSAKAQARCCELEERTLAAETRLTEEVARFERTLGDVSDRAWSEREASRAELVRLVIAHRSEVGEVLGESAELLADVRGLLRSRALSAPGPAQTPDPATERARSARLLRGRWLVGFGVAATILAIAIMPLALLASTDPERALFVHLATGLRPLHALGLLAAALALAVGSLSRAIKDFESVQALDRPLHRVGPAAQESPTEQREGDQLPADQIRPFPRARANGSQPLGGVQSAHAAFTPWSSRTHLSTDPGADSGAEGS